MPSASEYKRPAPSVDILDKLRAACEDPSVTPAFADLAREAYGAIVTLTALRSNLESDLRAKENDLRLARLSGRVSDATLAAVRAIVGGECD